MNAAMILQAMRCVRVLPSGYHQRTWNSWEWQGRYVDCAEDTHAFFAVFDRRCLNASSYSGVLAVCYMIPCELSMEYMFLNNWLDILLSAATATTDVSISRWLNWLHAYLVGSPLSYELSSIDNGWPLWICIEFLNNSVTDNLGFDSSIFVS